MENLELDDDDDDDDDDDALALFGLAILGGGAAMATFHCDIMDWICVRCRCQSSTGMKIVSRCFGSSFNMSFTLISSTD